MSDPTVPHAQPGVPSAAGPSRPSSRRPYTGSRRPASSRPDTAATTVSDLGDLPEQQFFPEGDDIDEFDEYEDDEVEEDVFAFERPVTGAVPKVAFSETTSQSGTREVPRTAETGYTGYTGYSAETGLTGETGLSGVTGRTGRTGHAFGAASSASNQDYGHNFAYIQPTGNMDVGGHIPELHYDSSNPPPFSGTSNLNNSSFANTKRRVQEHVERVSEAQRPPTGGSLLSRLQRKRAHTATTNVTTTTELNFDATTEYTQTNTGSEFDSETGSFTTELTSGTRPGMSRRTKSSAHLIPGAVSETMSDFSSEGTTPRRGQSRAYSRGSYGMTEMTGDMTIPDGKTTWGDGMLGVMKGTSELNSGGGIDYDLVEEDSPYPEVRASVSNIDDVEMPALTIRSWTLGALLAIIFTAANTFFHFRTPSPFLGPTMIQVVSYPLGKFAAYIMPIRSWTLPRFLGGRQFSLNPGPFNIKEHTIICVMGNIAMSPAYGLYAVVSSELWYGKDFGFGFGMLLMLSTQLTGFTVAGLCRRFVVWPASMIWPTILAVSTTMNSFHAEDEGYGGGMTRFKFMMFCGAGAFAYNFIPGFLFTALSYFSYACWIAPNNRVVNTLFGVSTGLGFGLFTFDWTQIIWIGSPLVMPWWAQVNYLIGFVGFYWIVVPILYFTNVWYMAHLPINVIQAADRFGDTYDIFKILTPETTLNLTAYQEYSPVYLSASFNMTFMLAFAISTGILVHTALYHGPRIYRAIVNVRAEPDDIHMKLIRQYPEVPEWWFAVLLLICFTIAVIAIEVWHTGFPVWAYIIAILISFLYTVPAAFIYAMTGQSLAINLLAELIPGYIFPGQPIPGMLSKVFTVQTLNQTMNFVSDLKLGHYMKVPPRSTFFAQISASVIASFVVMGTKNVLFNAVPDICAARQKNSLTCSQDKVFFTSSIIWGLIGPGRLFSKGHMYHPQIWVLLIGALLPIPIFLYVRKWPRSVLRNLNIPLVFNAGFSIPPATGVNYTSFLMTGFVFQYVIRRKYFAWWSKYNYVLSVALDVGSLLCALFLFLVLGLPGARLNWWGNTVYQNTADWVGATAYLPIPENGFGPDTW